MAAGVCLFPHLPVPALLGRGLDTPVCMPVMFPRHDVVAWASLSHAMLQPRAGLFSNLLCFRATK